MFQRIQTLYLLVGVVFLLVFAAYVVEGRVEQGAWALAAVGVFSALIQFKNRVKQMRWVVFSGVYLLLLMGLHAWLWGFFAALLAPIAVIILLVLAWRAIRADEDLVRSVDRIR